MLRTLSIISALTVAMASPAFAATSVKISLTGKSSEAIAAEVSKAAYLVCRNVVNSAVVPQAKKTCVADTIAATNAKIAKAYAEAPTATLASR